MDESADGRRRDTEEYARFEELLIHLSSRFVNVPSGAVHREIEGVQRHICEMLGVDLSALWEVSAEDPSHLTLTHFYSAQRICCLPCAG